MFKELRKMKTSAKSIPCLWHGKYDIEN